MLETVCLGPGLRCRRPAMWVWNVRRGRQPTPRWCDRSTSSRALGRPPLEAESRHRKRHGALLGWRGVSWRTGRSGQGYSQASCHLFQALKPARPENLGGPCSPNTPAERMKHFHPLALTLPPSAKHRWPSRRMAGEHVWASMRHAGSCSEEPGRSPSFLLPPGLLRERTNPGPTESGSVTPKGIRFFGGSRALFNYLL